ncbi:hypothetical protein BIW11_00991 [Tropilaelaps mercedesae]|uniref:Uncharacterized protein n=1 Tax=Tropilaelaps mercedesae TaxID=418985 RepID=A0A1V9XL58_9ACAR|nr:hypothetical protein BIW11_00991 [Tropilaelaps mercedesae]
MHRIRVPYVHPIVCCTFKRAIRLLPSILLIAFVLSLIFVTLIQVAVIHSQRRAIYLQRRVNGVVSTASSSPLYAAQASASTYLSSYGIPNANPGSNNAGPPQLTKVGGAQPASSGSVNAGVGNQKPPVATLPTSGGSGGPAGPTAKPGEPALRVEAILDRSAPSVENFALSINNNANAARIRRIFDAVKCHMSNTGTSTNSSSGYSVNANNSASAGPTGSAGGSAGNAAVSQVAATPAISDGGCGGTNITLCPEVPSGLPIFPATGLQSSRNEDDIRVGGFRARPLSVRLQRNAQRRSFLSPASCSLNPESHVTAAQCTPTTVSCVVPVYEEVCVFVLGSTSEGRFRQAPFQQPGSEQRRPLATIGDVLILFLLSISSIGSLMLSGSQL